MLLFCQLQQLPVALILRAKALQTAKDTVTLLHGFFCTADGSFTDGLKGLFAYHLCCQCGCYRIIQIIGVQNAGDKRDTGALQLPVNRNSQPTAADDKNLRLSFGGIQLQRTILAVVAAAMDTIQLMDIRRCEYLLRRTAAVNMVSLDA